MERTKTIDAKLIGFSTVAALLGMGFAMAMGASADTGAAWRSQRGACDPERHEAVEQALEDGDYDEWKDLMGDRGRVTQVITKENFATFAAMHDAMEAGDTEEAERLRAELGLGVRPEDGTGYGRGMGMRGAGMMHRGAGKGDGSNNRWSK